MSSIEYSEVLSRFFSQASAYDLAKYPNEDRQEIFYEWIKSCSAQTAVRRLFSTIKTDNDSKTVSYELKHSVDKDTDKEFVIEILALGVAVRWTRPKVQNSDLMIQGMFNAEEKMYSQANHLDSLRSLLADSEARLKNEIASRNATWNSYLQKED